MAILNNLKKREIILISLLVIALITVSLYQTLATDITMNEGTATVTDLAYTFDIADTSGRIVTVNAGSNKVLDVFLTNNNSGTVKYGIAYTPSTITSSNVSVAVASTTRDPVTGTIGVGTEKQITLTITNNGSSNVTLTLVPIAGYENGGALIVPSNHTLIS